MLKKILILPVALLVGFVSFWIELISKIGLFLVAIYNIGLLILMAVCVVHHDWLGVAIALGFSFGVFVICFAFTALNDFLKGLIGFES